MPGPAARIELVALLALLALAALRCAVSLDPFPLWAEDPTQIPTAVIALTPASSLVVDAGILLAAACVVAAAARQGRAAPLWTGIAAALGFAGVLVHTIALHTGRPQLHLEHLLPGASWCAALGAGLATSASARHAAHRALILAVLLGVLGLLAVKGASQIFVEHPATLAAFNRDRDAALGARGWTPDSHMARGFIRRISQPEATGWFGLANVYATLMAFGTVALTGIAWRTGRAAERAQRFRAARLALFGAVLCAAALVAAGSKGGIGAAAVGLVLLALAGPLRTRIPRRFVPFLGPGLIVATLAGIALRGAVGERLHELSLLFRWFYAVGAARIIADHPLLGVGPGGFQAAYLLAKPPISPEAVTSPHSVLLDWAAMLGVLGLGWIALFLAWSARAGCALLAPLLDENTDATPDLRASIRLAFLPLACATVVGAILEAPIASPLTTGVRAIGLLAGTLLAAAPLLATTRGLAITAPLAAAALAAAVHAQIELTATNTSAAAWFMLALGAAAAPGAAGLGATGLGATGGSPASATPSTHPSSPLRGYFPALVLFLASTLILSAYPRIRAWQLQLRAANDLVAPIAETNATLREISTSPASAPALARELATHLSALTGTRVDATPSSISQTLTALSLERFPAAAAPLRGATRSLPTHFPTAEALSRLLAQHSQLLRSLDRPRDADAAAAEAEAIIRDYLAEKPGSAAAWGWLGTLARGQAETTGDTSNLTRAIAAWEQAAGGDPYAPAYPVQIALAYARLEQPDPAATWAREALRLDKLTRLDPLAGLSETQRAQMQRLADPPPPGP